MLVPAAMVLIQSFQPPLWRFTCSRIKPKTFAEAGRRRWSARALRCAASRRARKLLGAEPGGIAVVKLMTLEEIVIDIGRSGRIALEPSNSLPGMYGTSWPLGARMVRRLVSLVRLRWCRRRGP